MSVIKLKKILPTYSIFSGSLQYDFLGLMYLYCILFDLFSRAENKLELRHTLEGHQLGVVSVDINSTGNSILT